MARILTITMNPSIDVSTSVDRVIPSSKLRCGAMRRDPGGGGINVARVAKRLGADVLAFYTAGGERGQMLRRMMALEGIDGFSLAVADDTREDFTVDEISSGHQFRFVSAGPLMSEVEWRGALAALAGLRGEFDFVIASGSLPPGVPETFYAEAALIAAARNAAFAVDASGAALRGALEARIDLLKPSLRELRDLTGLPLDDPDSCVAACRLLILENKAKVVALTLGSEGAMLVSATEAWRAWPLPILAISTVGAGDSFLAALVAALADRRPLVEAFRRAVAAGSAALLAPGTQLCKVADVDELVTRVLVDSLS